jgi:SpoVK/Ycf46/Vps4 family AAA+-type ATPase
MANKLDYDIITEQKRLLVKKSDVLEFIPLKETMSDVGGFDNYQQWLSKRAGAFTDDAKEFGVTPPRGILLVGVPGGGKSLCAKSTASSLKIPLIRFDLSKVFGSLVGQSESRMRGALKVAEAVAPCVLWLDEVEKALSGSSSGDHDTGVSARVLGQFLEWRAETTAEVFVCCTSNNIHGIPPEFYRPGRIDAIFYAGNPDLKGRIEILEIHLRKRGRSAKEAPNINYVEVAKATEGYTGAEIELAVIEAIFTAYNEGKRDLTTDLLLDAVKCIVPQSRRNKEDMVELEQWAKDRAIPVAKPAPEKQIRVARPIAKNFN